MNCLDVVQVRDNGGGIWPGDRENVCRRWWTSKLGGWEEMARWGGKGAGGATLGFRGEALASACEMSGGVEIVTRVVGEKVAWVGGFDRAGMLARWVNFILGVGEKGRGRAGARQMG